jgi:hypothetical protein
MNSIEKLREKMASTVDALERKEMSAEEAMAICRAGAVVIGSLRVELQYRQSRAEKPRIPFIDANPHRGSEFCGNCGDLGMIPGTEPNDDVMNTPCPKCNPRNASILP